MLSIVCIARNMLDGVTMLNFSLGVVCLGLHCPVCCILGCCVNTPTSDSDRPCT